MTRRECEEMLLVELDELLGSGNSNHPWFRLVRDHMAAMAMLRAVHSDCLYCKHYSPSKCVAAQLLTAYHADQGEGK
jgi:hypothetical protein